MKNKGGRPLKFDAARKAKYLEALEGPARGVIGIAAGIAGIGTETVRAHRERDEVFAVNENRAREAFGDIVEHEFLRRAMEGVPKPVFYKGKLLKHDVREWSDALIIKALHRFKPEYRDRQTFDVNHAGGVMVIDSEQTPDDWENDRDSG